MSRGDSTAAMLLRIEADPSQATAALREVEGAVGPLQSAIQSATSTALVPMREHIQHMPSEFTEARHAIHGVGEEIGIHMPRFIQAFLVEIPGVAPALASAFSVIAIVGILEMIAEKLPAAWDKLTEKITGWGATARKEYESLLEANRKVEEGLLHFQMRLNEAMGKDAEVNIKLVQDRMVETRKEIVSVNKAIEDGKTLQFEMGMVMEKEAPNVEQLRQHLAALHKTETELSVLNKKLVEDRYIEQAKDVEETRKWFGHKIEESDKFKEQQAKHEEELTKKNYGEVAKRQHLEQEAWNAHVRFDEEARKYDAETVKMEQQNAAAAAKFKFEANLEYWRETKKGEDDLTKTLHEVTQTRVREIVNNYKEQQRLAKENAKEFEKLERELEANERTMLQRRQRDFQEFGNVVSGVFSRLQGAQRAWVDAGVKAFEEITTALIMHTATENQSLITKAALKAAYNAAKALEDLGDFNYWSAAKHGAAAIAFGALAAAPIVTAAMGASGTGSPGSSGSVSPGGGPTGSWPSVAMAPGAQSTQAPLHVVIMGEGAQAQYLATMLNKGTRTQGVQLAATHTAQGAAL